MDTRRIVLAGKSQKGKNRIYECGPVWEVIMTFDKVLFSSIAGPWLFLQAVASPDKVRWIHEKNDSDFVIV